MKNLALTFTPLLFGCLAATAQATTTVASDVPYEVVNYADLNIANRSDAAILLQRVKAAARRVCGRHVELLPLDFQHPVQRCTKAATTRAMADVYGRSTVVAYVIR